MSDYERYGDYNEIEDDSPKSNSTVILIIKILIGAVCVGVIGIIAFRLILFNNYPDSVKLVYFDDVLSDHYLEKNGHIEVKTQKLRAPYDDPELGYFFCDYLYVIDECDQMQITVRYNTASVERISEELGIKIDPDNEGSFSYRLTDNYGRVYDNVTVAAFDSSMMYRYAKLVVNGADASPAEKTPEWIRLEIFVTGGDLSKPYSMVPIYENNEIFSDFKIYELSEEERP